MSFAFKQITQLFDAPLAIVVGAVAAVLVAGQIGATGLGAQDDATQDFQQESAARLQRMAVINCLGVRGDAAREACVHSQRRTMGIQDAAPEAAEPPAGRVTLSSAGPFGEPDTR